MTGYPEVIVEINEGRRNSFRTNVFSHRSARKILLQTGLTPFSRWTSSRITNG